MTGSIPPPTPLSYEGQVVVPFIQRTFSPLSTFNTFPLPTVWINTTAKTAFILVNKALGVATWAPIGGAPGEIDTITTPDATVVVPTAGNINFLNGTSMAITGSGSSVTFNVGGNVATLYTEDAGTAVPSNGNLIITGGSTGLTTTGSGQTVSMTGTLAVNHGGTSLSTLTTHGVLIGAGTSAVAFAGPNASTHAVFMAQGASADPAFTTTGTPYVSGVSFDAGSNTLSNYATASWNPNLAFGGASTGITYADQSAVYTRIGRVVFFQIIMTLTSKGSATGNATLDGFPFAPGIETATQIASFSALTLSGGYTDPALQIIGATTFNLVQSGSGVAVAPLTDANFANGTRIEFQGFYAV